MCVTVVRSVKCSRNPATFEECDPEMEPSSQFSHLVYITVVTTNPLPDRYLVMFGNYILECGYH